MSRITTGDTAGMTECLLWVESGHSAGYHPKMDKGEFQAFFVVGPLLFSSIIPTLIFAVALGQWGSNVIWGSVFGLGWCLAASASGTLFESFSTTIGIVWGWFVLIPLYYISGWLWGRLPEKRHKSAINTLLLSFLVAVPAETISAWDLHGFHLPDYTLHFATYG